MFIRGGSRDGYPVFLLLLLFSKLFCFISVFVCLLVCVRLVFFSFCIYNRKTAYKNRKQQTKTRRKHKNNRKHRNTLFPSRNLRDIHSQSGPGVDILYLCCLFIYSCFSRSCYVVFMFVNLFVCVLVLVVIVLCLIC